MTRHEEYELQKRKVDALWEKYSEHMEELWACRDEKKECEMTLARAKEARKQKRKGNFLIFLGFLLIIAEVLAVMYYSPFEPVDAVIIGVVFLWGLLRKRSGRREYREIMGKCGPVDTLPQRIAELDAKIQEYGKAQKEYNNAKESLERMLRYTGKEWDLYNIRLSGSTISALERDLNDLMFVLGRSSDSDYVLNNWFTLSRLEALTARVAKNNSIIRKEDAMLRQLGDSSSWILVATSIAMSIIELNLMRFGWKSGDPMTFAEGLDMSQARPAMSEEEKEYQENLSLAVDNIVKISSNKLSQMMK